MERQGKRKRETQEEKKTQRDKTGEVTSDDEKKVRLVVFCLGSLLLLPDTYASG